MKFYLLLFLLPGFTALRAQSTTFTLDPAQKMQMIENIGASGCWFSEGIGQHWPQDRKDSIARLLFSRHFNAEGRPEGIGLSAWRFNIGGGTAGQGDSSGISTAVKRVESFLSADGTYNWSRQSGYQWFLRKAKAYGVENLIAFSNTPPVFFTQNHLGFKLQKDYVANLRPDQYGAYAKFLAEVLRHFEQEGLRFQYVSPVNEPQWDWSNEFGKMNQEGSPWHNEDIYKVAVSLDSMLRKYRLNTKILVPEAGTLTHLYKGTGQAANQLQTFFSGTGPYDLGKLPHLLRAVAGHSYFTDAGDSMLVNVRSQLRDTAAKYNVPFWQSEYSMLGNGYKEGKQGRIPAMDCALFLAKMIYHDLAVAHASAWHLWNSYEPGNADFDTRYYLLALRTNADNSSGTFSITKNLWALGHYSLFIRPGMQAIGVSRTDGLDAIAAAKNVMVSAYTDNKKRVVAVAINYTAEEQRISLEVPGGHPFQRIQQYLTTGDQDVNMKPAALPGVNNITLPARSIATFVLDR